MYYCRGFAFAVYRLWSVDWILNTLALANEQQAASKAKKTRYEWQEQMLYDFVSLSIPLAHVKLSRKMKNAE